MGYLQNYSSHPNDLFATFSLYLTACIEVNASLRQRRIDLAAVCFQVLRPDSREFGTTFQLRFRAGPGGIDFNYLVLQTAMRN